MYQLTARVTADATVKTFDSGRSVVNFNVAKNRSYKNKEGKRITDADFYQCSYWVTSKVAKYLTKGQIVELLGHIKIRKYQTKDGANKSVLQFITSQIVFHTAQRKEESESSTAEGKNKPNENDDLPF